MVACFFFVPHFVSLWSWIVEWMNDVLNCSSVTNFVTLTMKMEDHLERSSSITQQRSDTILSSSQDTKARLLGRKQSSAKKKNERKTRSWYIRLSDLMHDGSFLRHFKLQALFSPFLPLLFSLSLFLSLSLLPPKIYLLFHAFIPPHFYYYLFKSTLANSFICSLIVPLLPFY